MSLKVTEVKQLKKVNTYCRAPQDRLYSMHINEHEHDPALLPAHPPRCVWVKYSITVVKIVKMEESFQSLSTLASYLKNLADNNDTFSKITSTKNFGDEGSLLTSC